MDPLVDSLEYTWSNQLPSPIIYHTEPGLNELHIGNAESQATMVPVAELCSQSMPHSVSHEGMEVEIEQKTPRRRYRNTDWEIHKDTLHQLYIVDGLHLSAVEEHMKRVHGFGPTKKQYKDKFKSWKWIKRLPGDVAQWMVEKASEREMEDGKGTVFIYKGQVWTAGQAAASASRTRKVTLVDTPRDIDWETPRSPGSGEHSPDFQEDDIQAPEHEATNALQPFPLSWNGKSRANLIEVLNLARELSREGHVSRALQEYTEALEGHRYLLTPTHEETTRIVYELANLYAMHGREADANKVLERCSGDFAERWGVAHQKTYQHGLDMVNLLKTWGRESDALALLAHAQDIYEQADNNSRCTDRARSRRQRNPELSAEAPFRRIERLQSDIANIPNLARIDHGIGAARAYVATGESSVEPLIQRIEELCFANRAQFGKQALQARAERLKLYVRLDSTLIHADVFQNAVRLLESCWVEFAWDKRKISSLDFLEACMEIASPLLKAGYDDHSSLIFQKVEMKAISLFGFDDERAIWTLISIGLIYQTVQTWNNARRWFEQALAAALSAYENDDGIVRALETGIEKEYFSYVTDEGQPYESIFGVTGLIIRPRRLHIG